MTKTVERYNGYTNYATWNVALWGSNDEGSYNYIRQNRPQRGYTALTAKRIGMDLWPEGTPDLPRWRGGGRVNWAEVAAAFNEF